MTEGWISLHRKVKDHWLWKDPVKFQWWIDILLTVNHTEAKVNLGNQIVLCKRGQSVKSLQTWAEEWKTSKSMVRRFFDLLKSDGMIETENVVKSTRITVCKYDSYQDLRHASGTHPKRTRHASGTHPAPNNKENKENKENNENNGAKAPLTNAELFNLQVEQELSEMNEEGIETWQRYKSWFDSMGFKSVTKIPEQITPKQLLKLADQFSASLIKDKLTRMENRKKLDYKSVYLTLNNWLKTDVPV